MDLAISQAFAPGQLRQRHDAARMTHDEITGRGTAPARAGEHGLNQTVNPNQRLAQGVVVEPLRQSSLNRMTSYFYGDRTRR
jgi:hypothetical protein